MSYVQMTIPLTISETRAVPGKVWAGIPFCDHRDKCLRRPRIAGGWPLPGHLTDDDCEAWPYCLKKTNGEDGPANPIAEDSHA